MSPDGQRKTVGALNSGPAFKVADPPVDGTYYEIDGEFYTSAYKRVLIRRKDVS